MGRITISIKDEAYEYLKSLKGKDKSFSDVILDFKKTKTSLSVAADALIRDKKCSSNEVDEWKERIQKARELDEIRRYDR